MVEAIITSIVNAITSRMIKCTNNNISSTSYKIMLYKMILSMFVHLNKQIVFNLLFVHKLMSKNNLKTVKIGGRN